MSGGFCIGDCPRPEGPIRYTSSITLEGDSGEEVTLLRLTSLFRWSKAKFKSPCNCEESPFVARVFSPGVIYENVDIVFIEIYRIR